MIEPIPLTALLGALSTEAQDLAEDLRRLEAALVPTLLSRPAMVEMLQPFDPLMQRLMALSRIAAVAAEEAPSSPMAATAACLHSLRLACFLRDLRPSAPEDQDEPANALFEICPACRTG